MKKILIPLLISAMFIVTSCNWQVPQKVVVETQANYEFSLGDSLFKAMNTDSLFGEFDIKSSIMDGISFNNSVVYDYFPGQADDTLQQFLIKIPIQEIPLDFSQYMQNGDFSTAMEKVSIDDTTFTVPEVGDSHVEASVDTASLNKALGALVTAAGTANGDYNNLQYKSDTVGSFSTLTVSSGTYIVTGNFSDYTSVYIYNGNKEASGTFYNGKAELSLNNFEFNQSTKILISTSGSYAAYASPDSFTISQVTGVTSVSPIEVDMQPCTFEVLSKDSASDFRSAVIGEGAITVTTKYDSSWTGITPSYKVALSGSLNLSERTTDGSVDLANCAITGTDDTTLNSKLLLTLQNSTLDFAKASSLSVLAENKIESFASVTVKYDKDLSSVNNSELPETFMDTVKTIYLLSSGIEGNFKNTLPEGNPITLSIKSDFLGLDKSESLASGTESGNYSMLSGITSAVERKIGNPAEVTGAYNSIDFEVSITLPGATAENPDQVVLKNVKPSDSYTIGLSINPVIDYEKLVIDTSGYRQEGSQEIGLNLTSLFSALSFGGVNLGEKIEFDSLPLYLLAVKPSYTDDSGKDVFADAKFTGKIELFMGKNGTPAKDVNGDLAQLYMLGNSSTDGTLAFADMPNLQADENKLVTIDFAKEMKSEKSENKVINKDMTEILNKKFSDDEVALNLKYNISFSNGSGSASELEVYKSQLDTSAGAASSIAVIAYIEVPLKFNLTSDLDLPLIEKEESTEEEASEETTSPEGMEFLNILESATLSVTPTVLPFYTNPAMTLDVGITKDIKKNLALETGRTSEFDINKNQFKSLISSMTSGSGFAPELSISMKKGSITLPRNIDFSAIIKLGLSTNGTIEVYPEFSFGGN